MSNIVISLLLLIGGYFVGFYMTWFMYIIPIAFILMFWDSAKNSLDSYVSQIIVVAFGLVLFGMLVGDIVKIFDGTTLSFLMDK